MTISSFVLGELKIILDGDSLDRERVRDILLDKFNYDHKGGTW